MQSQLPCRAPEYTEYTVYYFNLLFPTSLNLITFTHFPTLQHQHERSQRDHRRVRVWRQVRQQHTHHLCDKLSAAVSGNQSQSQHRRRRRRQDGKRGQSKRLTSLPTHNSVVSVSAPRQQFDHTFLFVSFFRIMQISSTLTCGRPGSRGAVCLHLRRARLPSSLKDRPSCWTPTPLCWKCSLFKVQMPTYHGSLKWLREVVLFSFLPFCILLLLFSFLSFHLKQFIRSQIKFIYYFLGAKFVASLESSLLSTTQTSISLSCQQVNNNTCYYNFVNWCFFVLRRDVGFRWSGHRAAGGKHPDRGRRTPPDRPRGGAIPAQGHHHTSRKPALTWASCLWN